MKHYMKAVHRLKEQFQDVDDPKILRRLAIAFSNRIDLLEKYITENTDTDGTKVGYKNPPSDDEIKR